MHQSTSGQLELEIVHQSTSGQLELAAWAVCCSQIPGMTAWAVCCTQIPGIIDLASVNQRPAGTEILAPVKPAVWDRQSESGLEPVVRGCLQPAE